MHRRPTGGSRTGTVLQRNETKVDRAFHAHARKNEVPNTIDVLQKTKRLLGKLPSLLTC